jgi:RIO kinase 1
MSDALTALLADGVIDEVVGRLKSGKEADIWLVRHAGEVVAAKVYKERHARSFRNNAAYKEGRRVRNTRTQRAMDRGSRFGHAAAEEAWKAKESDALHRLHAAGVRVPRPVLFYEGVLLMEAVVDADGRPAPRLVDAQVPRAMAATWYADLRQQAVKMLACDVIHGDLSPYNVLVGHAGLVVIDFPQVVGAAHNSQARRFFLRDVENVRRHFAAIDPALHGRAGDGDEIWRAYERRELTPDFTPSGRRAAAATEPRAEVRPHGHAHHPAGASHGRPAQPHAARDRSAHRGPKHPQAHPRHPQPAAAPKPSHDVGAPSRSAPVPANVGPQQDAGRRGRRRRRRRQR